MATSTARYRFEFRLLEWAETFSRKLAGSRNSVFVGMRDDASIRRIYMARAGTSFDGDRKSTLVEAHPRWLLYTPYDEAGTGYLEWFALPQSVAERWIGRPLEMADFLDVRSSSTRNDWPETWRVIVR